MLQLLGIAIGGALGATLRFITSQRIHLWFGTGFPYGILIVNILGCFLMGVLASLFIYRYEIDPVWRAAILIGFLGGFTTFSSFSIDTFNLIEAGAMLKAFVYVILSFVLSLTATWIGVLLGRSF